jgi:ABC-2 type transport system ATP-binding protein
MHGVSYAGGIELVAAGIDRRIDAIAPSIAWSSLLTALYRDELAKGGWGAALAGLGLPTATFEGLLSPAGPQSGTLDPHIMSGLASGLSTGKFSAEDRAWFDSRGPTSLVDAIRVPTLLVQGTADTLFTPSEAMRNHEILARNRVPLKMLWFCGGHGVCLSGDGGADRVEPAVIAWMQRWLAGDRSVDTGPAFEWIADDARWRSTATFPPRAGRPIVAQGTGRLVLSPADASSGTAVAAGRAANAVNVAIPPPAAAADVVGEPELTLSYTGTGSAPDAHVFAQTIHRAGDVTLHSAKLTLPTADPSAVSLSGSVLGGSRTCLSRRRFAIRLRAPRGQRLRSARVTVGGKRVKVQRRRGRLRAIVDLRGRVKTSVRVVVVARPTKGRRVRETRVYRTCTPRARRR